MNKNMLLLVGSYSLLIAAAGACIGQRIGFKKVDKALMKVYNSENGGTKKIKGVEYLVTVTKK